MRFGMGLPKNGNELDTKIDAEIDPELAEALRDFRSSVHAWSEAEFSQPHQPVRIARWMSWRLATGCALGCVLVAGSLTGGIYDHHQRQVAKIAAAAEAARQQKLKVEQRAVKNNDDLMAEVNSAVSRQVPQAMEPLAQLMAEDDTQ